MNNFLKRSLLAAAAASPFLASTALLADWPTLRPLPPLVVADQPDWKLLRSSEIPNKFFIVPRRVSVTSQSLSNERKSVEDCIIVDSYNLKERTLVEVEQSKSRVLLNRQKNIEFLSTLDEQKRNLAKNLEDNRIALENAKGTGNQAEITRLQNMISILSGHQVEVQTQITDATTMDENLKKDLQAVTDQIAIERTALETLRGQTMEPVATFKAQLKIPKAQLSSDSWKVQLGLQSRDIVARPKVYGLYLRPAGDEVLNSSANEIPILEEQLKRYRPIWGQKGLLFNEEILNDVGLLNVAATIDLPDNFTFSRPLTLNDYCAIKRKDKLDSEIAEDFQISTVNVAWTDDDVQRLNGTQLFAYTTKLSDDELAALKPITSPKTNDQTGSEIEDLGDPARYSGPGHYSSVSTVLDTINALKNAPGDSK